MAGDPKFVKCNRLLNQLTTFMEACNKAKGVPPFVGTLLALDPGEITGWAVFDVSWVTINTGPNTLRRITLVGYGQEPTFPMDDCVGGLTKLFETFRPTKVVHELYAVYEWKTDSHAWSQVPTLRIIGSLETLCIQRNVSLSSQTAQIAKNFCTDDKLKIWGLYEKGLRHARDAARHGAYYLLFGGQ